MLLILNFKVLFAFSSNFVAIFMLCSLVVHLKRNGNYFKRNGNYFKRIEITISPLVLSLTFQLKANERV